MNCHSLKPLAAAILLASSSVAMAQTATQPAAGANRTTPANTASESKAGSPAATTGRTNDYSGMRDAKVWERTHRVSKIIGTDVVNAKGEKVGDVEDIVLDANGNVAYAVVSTGGFLGIGDRMHAVPWSAIRTNTGNDNFALDVDKDRLRSAPGFDKSNWPNVNDPKWSSDNRRYFPAADSTRAPVAAPTGGSK